MRDQLHNPYHAFVLACRIFTLYHLLIPLKHDKAVVCIVVITISSTALFFLIISKQDSFASESSIIRIINIKFNSSIPRVG